MIQFLLMAHVFLGVFFILAGVWVFVDVLNVSEQNWKRIRLLSGWMAAAMWLSFLIAGRWYVAFYPKDKAIILKGPWPWAHNFFMETKEHLAMLLLMLATYLPMVAANNLTSNARARTLMLYLTSVAVLIALAMEGEGALIAMGVKVGLLSH